MEPDVTGGSLANLADTTAPFRGRGSVLAACIIILAGFVVYWSSLGHPFLFDDEEVITENAHVRRLWPLSFAMGAPEQSAVSGRPLVSLSLAINYYCNGLRPAGYRAFNVGMHVLAALALLGIVRRTLISPRLAARFGADATWLASIVALIWLLHPLQTESVTYITQRSELMAGMFCLLTLYCSIRGFSSRHAAFWFAGTVLACGLGMLVKEVMVTAPLLVLLYDRTFDSGSFRQSLRRRPIFYAVMACTWIILGMLIASGPRSGSAGFGLEHLGPLDYAKSQPGVILHYLRLAFWPDSLCLDYHWPVAEGITGVWMPTVAILAMVAVTIGLMVWRPPIGLLAAWFFITLAPTSSIVPILDLAFEHRMYLPLAALGTMLVVAVYLLAQWIGQQRVSARRLVRALAALLGAATIAALGARTVQRNGDYRSPLTMWGDVLSKRPDNPRAHNNLASYLYGHGQLDQAIEHLREALRLKPDYDMAHTNLAVVLADHGDLEAALEHGDKAVALRPNWAEVHKNRAYVLFARGDFEGAATAYRRALELEPSYAAAHHGLASALLKLGRPEAAMDQYRLAIEFQPDNAEAHNDLGALLAKRGDNARAIRHYEMALELRPDWAEAHYNLGLAMASSGKFNEAAASYRRALRINPHYLQARFNLGNALLASGRPDLAVEQYQLALDEKPDYFEADCNLGTALKALHRDDEAAARFAEAMRTALQKGQEL
ncbi:MAG TPA: tetratricopeptide repeat protein, partial [Phycisphaerae bacterium]|nr:tetratricopeptide repeat protein [Phycisphaerae bacterium]